MCLGVVLGNCHSPKGVVLRRAGDTTETASGLRKRASWMSFERFAANFLACLARAVSGLLAQFPMVNRVTLEGADRRALPRSASRGLCAR